jgi:ABC-type uncharacterized transport system fused permease/ATPase subunit
VRVRENAESIAFYRGEARELDVLRSGLSRLVANYGELLKASRNLDFFTSMYRWASGGGVGRGARGLRR